MLEKIGIRFDPVQDRLVLRLTVKVGRGNAGQAEPVEHWLHVTRRVCATWRQDLQAMLDLSVQAPETVDPPTKRALSSAHHQAMAEQAASRTERAVYATASLPEPALVRRVVCGRRRADGRWMIRFEALDRPALTLFLAAQTLHGLVAMLSQRVRDTGWDLPALPSEARAAPGPSPGGAHLH